MIAAVLVFAAMAGIAFDFGFSHTLVQPDWALAVLAAALLAHRGAWTWVAPAAAVHDLLVYDSLWGLLPFALAIPLLMPYLDFHLGPGLPQRLVFMLLALTPMLCFGEPVSAWLLTAACLVPLWFLLAGYYAQRA